jgi:hypothetical protein
MVALENTWVWGASDNTFHNSLLFLKPSLSLRNRSFFRLEVGISLRDRIRSLSFTSVTFVWVRSLTASTDTASVLHHSYLAVSFLRVNPLQIFVKAVLFLVQVFATKYIVAWLVTVVIVSSIRGTTMVSNHGYFNFWAKSSSRVSLSRHWDVLPLLVSVLVNSLYGLNSLARSRLSGG